MNARTLYLLDDNEDFLDATRFWLEGMGLSVDAWSNPRDAIAALARRDRTKRACLMLDIRMPELSGLDVHDALVAADAALPIIYMSGHANVALAVQAMQKGAVTLLEKPFDEDSLSAALEQAYNLAPNTDNQWADSTKAGGKANPGGAPAPAEPSMESEARERFLAREASLSPREREVLGYVIEGVYNKNIADQIGLSIKTVELYRARGMAKMQARSVAELTRMMVSEQARS